ncbi:MAG: hypothetical protein J6S14_02045 [Clostridia bacterium]|nr:hypothetical protein [Clostridia bacterium]
MATVDTLQIEISASSEKASAAIDKLVTSMSKLKNSLSGQRFGSVTKGLRELGQATRDMGGSISALSKMSRALERLSNIGSIRIPKSIGDGIRNIGVAAETISPQALENLDRLTRSLQRLQNTDLRGLSSTLRNTGRGTSEPTEQSRERFKLNIDTSPLQRVRELASAAAMHLRSLGQKIVMRINDATLGKVKKNLEGVSTIFKSLGRIAFYRLIRAAIKAVSQAFDEGLKNAYAFSKGLGDAVDGRIAVALDGLTSSATTMKNQLGAAFGSLLTAIAPIISTLINLITALATAITQLFAAFTGGTFLRAKNVSADFADNMKAGGGAAKEWKNQLMGFDEINRLDDQSGGGGGGGGGLSADDMFEVATVDSAIQSFVDNLKSAVMNQEWMTVGTLIGGKINEAINNIPWAALGAKFGTLVDGIIQSAYYTLKEVNFTNLGAKIAEFITSALNNINFAVWGALVVRKFTAMVDLVMGFLSNPQTWTSLATSISNFLRGALDEASSWLGSYSWTDVATTLSDNLIAGIEALNAFGLATSLSSFIRKGINALKLFVGAIKWKEIGEALANGLNTFFNNLGDGGTGVADLASAISTFINGALALLTTLVTGLDWKSTATGMSDALITFVKELPVASLVTSLYNFIASAVSSLVTFIWNIKWGELANEILAQISTALGALAGNAFKSLMKLFDIPEDETDIATIAGMMVTKLSDGIKSAIDAAVGWVSTYIITPIKDAFTKWKAGDTTLEEIGKDIWEGIKNGVKKALDTIGTWLKDHVWTPFVNGFKSVFGIASPSTEMEPYGEYVWEGVLEGIKSAISAVRTWVNDNIWQPFVNAIKSFFGIDSIDVRMNPYGVNVISGLVNGIRNGAVGLGTSIYNTVWPPIQNALNNIMAAIREWWAGVKAFFSSSSIDARVAASIEDGSIYLQGFASGGYVQPGELFLAREAGPELVGTIGGRTAVANNDQIVAAVSAGVFEAVTAAMGGSGSGGQAVIINLDGREIARSTTKYQNQMARAGAY